MDIDSILKEAFKDAKTIKTASIDYKIEDSEEDAPVGLNSLVNASKKLLAINRGQVEPDERDSLRYNFSDENI